MNRLLFISRIAALACSIAGLSACASGGAAPLQKTRPRAATSAPPEPSAASRALKARRFQVAFGDVRQLASVLENILEVRRRDQGPVRAILVDDPTGDLIVFGTEEGIAAVDGLMSPACEVKPSEEGEVTVLRLQNLPAMEAVRVASRLIGSRAVFLADAPTNSLLVRAGPEDLEQIRRLVAELDAPKVAQ